jgi:hypothetical protein
MNKNSKTSSKRLKDTFDSGKDTDKIKILIRAKNISPGTVEVKFFDQDFEIGMIICPESWYDNNDAYFSIMDKILMDYSLSPEFDKVQKSKGSKK